MELETEEEKQINEQVVIVMSSKSPLALSLEFVRMRLDLPAIIGIARR